MGKRKAVQGINLDSASDEQSVVGKWSKGEVTADCILWSDGQDPDTITLSEDGRTLTMVQVNAQCVTHTHACVCAHSGAGK